MPLTTFCPHQQSHQAPESNTFPQPSPASVCDMAPTTKLPGVTLYHLPGSRSSMVAFLLNELGLSVNVEEFKVSFREQDLS